MGLDESVEIFEREGFDQRQLLFGVPEPKLLVVLVESAAQTLGEGFVAQRLAAEQKHLRVVELLLCGPFGDEFGDHLFDHLQRLLLTLEFGLQVAAEVAAAFVEHDASVGAVGEPPFHPDLLHQTAAEAAAAQDESGHTGLVGVGIVHFQTIRRAEIDVGLLRLPVFLNRFGFVARFEKGKLLALSRRQYAQGVSGVPFRLFQAHIPADHDDGAFQSKMLLQKAFHISERERFDVIHRPIRRTGKRRPCKE